MERKKSSTAIIVVLVLVIIGLGSFIIYDKLIAKDNLKITNTQDNETLKDNEPNVETPANETLKDDEKNEEIQNELEGQFYLLEGLFDKRRYYLAFDSTEMMEVDTLSGDFKTKKVYLVDMNLSETNEFIKEIDFSKLIEDIYKEKINSLPDVLAAGTVNETKKSEINIYKMQYVENDAKYYMYNGKNEIPFGISYVGVHDYEGRSNVAELSLGTEYYVLDVLTMTVRKVS